jgi:hypothetical protein
LTVTTEQLLDPEAAAAAGSALGQLAATLDGGGLLICTARLVEIGCRATILLAPGLFRWDLTPQEETLSIQPRTLGPWSSQWRAQESTWDGFRGAQMEPLEFQGAIDLGDDRALSVWMHILSFTDPDAGAVHFVSKAEIRPLPVG